MILCSCPSLQINSHFPQICHQECRQVTGFKPCIILDAMFLSRPTDKQSLPSDFSPRKLTIKSGDLEEEVCSIQLVFLLRLSISAPCATSHRLNSLFTQGNVVFFLRSVVNFLAWAAHHISWFTETSLHDAACTTACSA